MMSASISRIAVRNQLAAMRCDSFDIGVLQQSGRMLLREGWSAGQVESAIKWLQRENARGAQIFVRPHGEHPLSLLDDLASSAIFELKQSGFGPAVIVETSRRNFQAWLNHGRVLNRELSTQAAKELVRRFGGDPSSADWRHFGRLAGFTNQKPTRRLDNGFAPFVRLHEWDGRVYGKTDEFLGQISPELATAATERQACSPTTTSVSSDSIRPIAEFHGDPRYDGDLHRADMAWAIHAASRGLSPEEIRTEIFHARDLTKKGRAERQLQYAGRTAAKAVGSTHPIRA